MNETDVKNQIKGVLWSVGARPVPIGAGVFGENGISDLLVCYEGRFVAIEVKKPGWKPPGRNAKSYDHYYKQKMFLESIEAAGGVGFFASDVETVVERMGLKVKLFPLFERGG